MLRGGREKAACSSHMLRRMRTKSWRPRRDGSSSGVMPKRREHGEEVCHRPCAYRQGVLLWTQEGMGKKDEGIKGLCHQNQPKKMEGEKTVGEGESPEANVCGTYGHQS